MWETAGSLRLVEEFKKDTGTGNLSGEVGCSRSNGMEVAEMSGVVEERPKCRDG